MELKNNEAEALKNGLYNLNLLLCVYLKAGFVTESAIDEMYYSLKDSDELIYKIFTASYEKAKRGNLFFPSELMLTAKAVKSSDLLRFSALLSDNYEKGSELSDKLEAQRNMIRSERVNNAKKRAKEAETKLCFPLMLLLLGLIIMCISPALLNM